MMHENTSVGIRPEAFVVKLLANGRASLSELDNVVVLAVGKSLGGTAVRVGAVVVIALGRIVISNLWWWEAFEEMGDGLSIVEASSLEPAQLELIPA